MLLDKNGLLARELGVSSFPSILACQPASASNANSNSNSNSNSDSIVFLLEGERAISPVAGTAVRDYLY